MTCFAFCRNGQYLQLALGHLLETLDLLTKRLDSDLFFGIGVLVDVLVRFTSEEDDKGKE